MVEKLVKLLVSKIDAKLLEGVDLHSSVEYVIQEVHIIAIAYYNMVYRKVFEAKDVQYSNECLGF